MSGGSSSRARKRRSLAGKPGKRKTGGRDFQPGNPGGPGRPRLPDDIKGVKKITSEYYCGLVSRFLQMDPEQLRQITQDQTRPMLELLVAGMIFRATKEQDHTRAQFLFDRLMGKVKEQVEHSIVQPTIIERLDGSTVELGQRVLEGEVIENDGDRES